MHTSSADWEEYNQGVSGKSSKAVSQSIPAIGFTHFGDQQFLPEEYANGGVGAYDAPQSNLNHVYTRAPPPPPLPPPLPSARMSTVGEIYNGRTSTRQTGDDKFSSLKRSSRTGSFIKRLGSVSIDRVSRRLSGQHGYGALEEGGTLQRSKHSSTLKDDENIDIDLSNFGGPIPLSDLSETAEGADELLNRPAQASLIANYGNLGKPDCSESSRLGAGMGTIRRTTVRMSSNGTNYSHWNVVPSTEPYEGLRARQEAQQDAEKMGEITMLKGEKI